jgi:hypothetical protein
MRWTRLAFISLFSFLFITCNAFFKKSIAALPDQETYDFVTSKYTLLLEQTRGGCGYYANPNTLSITGNERTVSILMMRGQPGGTACNGVFEFQVLSVRCQTGEVSYSEQLASPANWQEDWHSNAEVAQQICSLAPFATARTQTSSAQTIESLPDGDYLYESSQLSTPDPNVTASRNIEVVFRKVGNIIVGIIFAYLDGNTCFKGEISGNTITNVLFADVVYTRNVYTRNEYWSGSPFSLDDYRTSSGQLPDYARSALQECVDVYKNSANESL